MIFKRYSFTHEYSNFSLSIEFPSQKNLILPTITNKTISPKLRQKYPLFISSSSTKEPDQ